MQLITVLACLLMFFYEINLVKTQIMDIVQTAINTGDFRILTAALDYADLTSTLRGNGLFTVFAPNDAAFDKIDMGTVADLLSLPNKGKLTRILQYHVINGRRLTASQINGMILPIKIATLGGSQVTLSRNSNNNLRVNNATIIAADINASNGIIHIIDTVLTPPGISLATSLSVHQSFLLTLVWTLVISYIRFE